MNRSQQISEIFHLFINTLFFLTCHWINLALAKSLAVIAADLCEASHLRDDQSPISRVTHEAGIQNDCGTSALPFAVNVQMPLACGKDA